MLGNRSGLARLPAAYALLRLTLGALLLFAGVGKLVGGVDEFASGLAERFAETWLPESLVVLAGQVLPFVEVALGALLVLGLLSVPALFGAGALMLLLTFGTTVVEDYEASGRNVVYALVVFVLLWVSERNEYALDRVVGAARRR